MQSILAIPVLLALAAADVPAKDAAAIFDAKVRALLTEHCLKCHSVAKRKGGLALDSLASILKGGNTGPAIVPGKPAESLLIQAVRQTGDLKMPPTGGLPVDAITTLERWIEREPPVAPKSEKSDWWSLRPLMQTPVPTIHNPKSAIHNPVDAFILAKLNERHLTPSPEADPRTLIRRVTFDLTGLPPTPDDVASFIADADPRAYERLIDRLLASPRLWRALGPTLARRRPLRRHARL